MVMEIAVHLTGLINAFKAKKMELKFPFFEGVDFL